jgi:hypothetical protein
MNTRRLVVMTCFVLVPSVALAIGPEVRREVPSNRPEIVEIGEPQPLGSKGLGHESKLNTDLGIYLDHYGWPDYAEIQEIEPENPWADYEVRIYYLKRDRELAFGRVFVAPWMKDFGVIKYQGTMDPMTHDRIVALATPPQTAMEEPQHVEFRPVKAPAPPPPSDIELLVRRVEAAADRASVAADRAAAASDAASKAADHTVTILEKMTQ